jgi:hypothetical protein
MTAITLKQTLVASVAVTAIAAAVLVQSRTKRFKRSDA